jgi:hypothetical protein
VDGATVGNGCCCYCGYLMVMKYLARKYKMIVRKEIVKMVRDDLYSVLKKITLKSWVLRRKRYYN